MNKTEKQIALEAAIKSIEKAHGQGSVMKLDEKRDLDLEVISTGSLGVDLALGIGGFPTGRVIEIYGPESSGKTTLALQVIAEAQKKDGTCLFVDTEHAMDPEYAKKLGVNLSGDKFILSQPDTGEQALEIIDTFVRSQSMKVIVLDSVAALVPKAELEGDMGDSHMGLHARLMSQALRKLTGVVKKSGCIVIFINQIRHKIGVMFGSPETTTGGNALKFYASIRLDIRKIAALKKNDSVYGHQTRVKVVKNKMAPPLKIAEFEILFGEGVSKLGEIVDLGVKYDLITKSGSWYSIGDTKVGQGREAVKEYLYENSEVCDEIERKLHGMINPTKNQEEPSEEKDKKEG
ncbi:recombinase RecA [Candidatus Cytomitobacter indipagum]|uniref:Protein RecA n=2 Tax=Candidatus Cytomitobacter indipagum TaxID=2601575 RepID=A0A5C0UF48_9PROT|nr:recombinase RecA [Candidatus Cytomitobacter indipagum]QEK38263.1 recombinase RecA [Candidatus Cytomitobacter indipagum]